MSSQFPQQGVESVPVAGRALDDDAIATRRDTLTAETRELLARMGGPGRKCDSPTGAGDSMPGQPGTRVAQHLADQARTPGQAGAKRDFPVTCKTATLNAAHGLTNGRRAFPRRHFHGPQFDPRRRTRLRSTFGND
jgi:hypothetical protein